MKTEVSSGSSGSNEQTAVRKIYVRSKWIYHSYFWQIVIIFFFGVVLFPSAALNVTMNVAHPLVLMHSTKRDRQRMEKYQKRILRFRLHSQLSLSLCSHDCISNTRRNGATFDPIRCSSRKYSNVVWFAQPLLFRAWFRNNFAVSHVRGIARQTRINQFY